MQPLSRKRISATASKTSKKVKSKATSLTKKQKNVVRTTWIAPNVPRSAGFPPTMLFTHRYHEQIVGQSVSTGITTYKFSTNGLYDPNITGTGHQPLYFDQLDLIYNHYRVLASKITWRVIGIASNAVGVRCCAYVDDDNSAPPSFAAIVEHRTGQVKYLNPDPSSQVIFQQRWTIDEYFPRQKFDDALKGSAAANPTEQSYYTLAISSDGVDTVSVSFLVEIEYFTEWSELKTTAQS